MLNKIKICVFTAARSDYFLLKPLLFNLQHNSDIELQIIVSGMHMCKEFGETWKKIASDGFLIDEKISMIISGDNSRDTVSSMGIGMIKFSDILSRLSPDVCVVLGDRFEMMSFATSCHILGIPIAHIHGGELTYGAFDDAIRHCITKMSTLHFPATEEYRRRIIQMGEHPNTVFNVGALAVENIKDNASKDKKEIEAILNIKLSEKYFLVTLHPETKGTSEVASQVAVLYGALENFSEYQVIWTCSNADPSGRALNELINTNFKNDNICVIDNLGDLYLSVLKNASAIIGNSSSGVIEAPVLDIPTVNIGTRQEGRLRTSLVIDCDFTEDSISNAIQKALKKDFKRNKGHPYGEGKTSKSIISTLTDFNFKKNYKKEFFDNKNEVTNDSI